MREADDAAAFRRFEFDTWQRSAERYEAAFSGATRAFIEPLLNAASVGPGIKLLDVACGPGYAAAAGSARGAKAIGVDFSPAMIAVARRRHPALEIHKGDAEHLPFPDLSFDAVVANFGLHLLPNPGKALAEAHRVLRPGGRVAFTAWPKPERNIAWQILLDAIKAHGTLDVKLPGGVTAELDEEAGCRRALIAARFVLRSVKAETLQATWRLSTPGHLYTGFRDGTARMAGLIAAQNPAVLPAVRTAVDRAAAAFERDGAVVLPLAAILAVAGKP
ncbi:MAG: methyltransferase domain-containing protein [Proteobacteria bacterium]|nr:methyltransferase domain-containing protein [Pseudomonadota bacterium]